MKNIIGRDREKKQLERLFDSTDSEFVAVYGRRRVGKTYLVREFFNKKTCIFFQVSGIKDGSLDLHLSEFKREIERAFYGESMSDFLKLPENWMTALSMLTDAIRLRGGRKKIVLFFDEFPWMATHKSGLLQALDYYWNRFWVSNHRIKLIICGSAASWIIENILNNKGGLHNRVTQRIHLDPFDLHETQHYLKSRRINFTQHQILDLYMCIGGIPHYLKLIEKGLSVVQNINQICFQKKGSLVDEFDNLFSSLFDHATIHEDIIKAIFTKREGMDRSELEKMMQIKGGTLSRYLKELEEAGFITSFIPWGKERGVYYRIIDEYTLFYLSWIHPIVKKKVKENSSTQYWESVVQSGSWKAWSGYAFEGVCYKHIGAIRKALSIPEGSTASSWRYVDKKGGLIGAQIDLLFDRPDGVISLCEIKYCSGPFVIDKKIADNLAQKIKVYQRETRTEKQIFISFVTSCRLKKTIYSEELVSSECTVDDLF
jgi:AAA+ ATPase superfamily predicted ATPase